MGREERMVLSVSDSLKTKYEAAKEAGKVRLFIPGHMRILHDGKHKLNHPMAAYVISRRYQLPDINDSEKSKWWATAAAIFELRNRKGVVDIEGDKLTPYERYVWALMQIKGLGGKRDIDKGKKELSALVREETRIRQKSVPSKAITQLCAMEMKELGASLDKKKLTAKDFIVRLRKAVDLDSENGEALHLLYQLLTRLIVKKKLKKLALSARETLDLKEYRDDVVVRLVIEAHPPFLYEKATSFSPTLAESTKDFYLFMAASQGSCRAQRAYWVMKPSETVEGIKTDDWLISAIHQGDIPAFYYYGKLLYNMSDQREYLTAKDYFERFQRLSPLRKDKYCRVLHNVSYFYLGHICQHLADLMPDTERLRKKALLKKALTQFFKFMIYSEPKMRIKYLKSTASDEALFRSVLTRVKTFYKHIPAAYVHIQECHLMESLDMKKSKMASLIKVWINPEEISNLSSPRRGRGRSRGISDRAKGLKKRLSRGFLSTISKELKTKESEADLAVTPSRDAGDVVDSAISPLEVSKALKDWCKRAMAMRKVHPFIPGHRKILHDKSQHRNHPLRAYILSLRYCSPDVNNLEKSRWWYTVAAILEQRNEKGASEIRGDKLTAYDRYVLALMLIKGIGGRKDVRQGKTLLKALEAKTSRKHPKDVRSKAITQLCAMDVKSFDWKYAETKLNDYSLDKNKVIAKELIGRLHFAVTLDPNNLKALYLLFQLITRISFKKSLKTLVLSESETLDLVVYREELLVHLAFEGYPPFMYERAMKLSPKVETPIANIYLLVAATQGLPKAKRTYWVRNPRVVFDGKEAITLLESAAQLGDATALFYYGRLHYNMPLQQKYSIAKVFFEQLQLLTHLKFSERDRTMLNASYFYLGHIYSHKAGRGEGADKDLRKKALKQYLNFMIFSSAGLRMKHLKSAGSQEGNFLSIVKIIKSCFVLTPAAYPFIDACNSRIPTKEKIRKMTLLMKVWENPDEIECLSGPRKSGTKSEVSTDKVKKGFSKARLMARRGGLKGKGGSSITSARAPILLSRGDRARTVGSILESLLVESGGSVVVSSSPEGSRSCSRCNNRERTSVLPSKAAINPPTTKETKSIIFFSPPNAPVKNKFAC